MMVKTELIKQGMAGKLGLTNYAVLSVMATVAEEGGVCTKRYRELSEMLDIDPKSVLRRVKELFKFEIEGRSILRKVPEGIQIAPEILEGEQNCNVNISAQNINNVSNAKGINASTVLDYFNAKYEEAYGIPYNFSIQRDRSMVNNKLLQLYGAENTLKIIDEAFQQRILFENPPKYPYITIGGLVSFIAQKVATDISQREKQDNFDPASFNKQMEEKYWDDYFGD